MNEGVLEKIIRNLSERQAAIPIVLGSAGLGLIQSLGEQGIRSIVVDDGPVSCRDFSRYCRRVVVPDISAAPEETGKALEMISSLARHYSRKLPLVFPTSDYILEYIIDHHDELKKIVSVVGPSLEVLKLTLNKAAFYEWLMNHNFPCPRTVFSSRRFRGAPFQRIELIPFPCIIKPALTFKLEQIADKKLYVAADQEEFFSCSKELSERNMEYVIQEIVPGKGEDQFSLAGYSGSGGRIEGYVMTNKLRQKDFGAGTFVSSADIPALYEIGEKILKILKYHGIFEIEFRKDQRDGSYKVIELNPRCWSQIMLATRMRVNVAYRAFCDFSSAGNHRRRMLSSCKKKYWMNFERDLTHLKRKIAVKDYSVSSFFSVMMSVPSIEPFSLLDLGPGIFYLRHKIAGRLKKGLRLP